MLREVVVSDVALNAFDDYDITAREKHPGDDFEDDCTVGDSIRDPDLIVVEVEVILRPINQPE